MSQQDNHLKKFLVRFVYSLLAQQRKIEDGQLNAWAGDFSPAQVKCSLNCEVALRNSRQYSV